jgi:hypothetical protein
MWSPGRTKTASVDMMGKRCANNQLMSNDGMTAIDFFPCARVSLN